MNKIVLSQPNFFPWVGIFEEIKLADIYVHYDDVNFSKGSFVNRTRIKTANGLKWITVPLKKFALGVNINKVQISYDTDWRRQHMELLHQAYAGAPYRKEMLDLVKSVYERNYSKLSELSVASIEEVSRYFGIADPANFLYSSELNVGGRNTQRVLDIVQKLGGKVYITGHGARNYLDHESFEQNEVTVQYMNYSQTPYPQQHGPFNPYVSILDLIANVGKDGVHWINSSPVYWRDFL
ncbi:WbqC family protein [Paenibacillus sp. HW567]|uniref:WbqC family protein n=1 Tax=Paenibacillus sp. HW567 TaxID=1034769 RepID=UPI000366C6C3|nr:WbqC family protein [Paenibacillus sp. HW567]